MLTVHFTRNGTGLGDFYIGIVVASLDATTLGILLFKPWYSNSKLVVANTNTTTANNLLINIYWICIL